MSVVRPFRRMAVHKTKFLTNKIKLTKPSEIATVSTCQANDFSGGQSEITKKAKYNTRTRNFRKPKIVGSKF